jgi:hypothetical protein
MDDKIEPLSRPQTNRTKPGFTETRTGDTITRDFTFANDPWEIVSNDRPHLVLITLTNIKLSLSLNLRTNQLFYGPSTFL